LVSSFCLQLGLCSGHYDEHYGAVSSISGGGGERADDGKKYRTGPL
jgi:hypothetical protein